MISNKIVIWCMKNILLYPLAAVGAFSIIYTLTNAVQHQQAAKRYLTNCSNVRVGMTLAEAQKMMNYDDSPIYRGEIRTNLYSGLSPAYFVMYPTSIVSSESVSIEFDPLTQRVTHVNCGKD